MKRRDFIINGTGLVGLLAASPTFADDSAKPIAIASASSGRNRAVVRLYHSKENGTLEMHLRSNGQSQKVIVRVGEVIALLAKYRSGDSIAFMSEDTQTKLDLRLDDNNASGRFYSDDGTEGEISANALDPITGAVIIVAIVAVVAVVAIISKDGGKVSGSVETPAGSGSVEIEVGGENSGDGIVANEACDGPPIQLC